MPRHLGAKVRGANRVLTFLRLANDLSTLYPLKSKEKRLLGAMLLRCRGTEQRSMKINDIHGQLISDWHDEAQICFNGHVVNEAMKGSPELNAEFCEQCGAETISNCQHCQMAIRGRYHASGLVLMNEYSAPAFCRGCGKPYSWTERALLAAKEILDGEQALTPEDRDTFEIDVNDIIRDVPRTRAAAFRIKAFLGKVPGAMGAALRDIVVDVASEAAKKIILGP
jgi:hypothetical protein